MTTEQSNAAPEETPFTLVQEKELAEIRASREERLEKHERTHEPRESLIGLAFSGGGIRSATFNLGVLQALAKHKLLRKFDYLSTVSGGGYIGSWLMGWLHHQRLGIPEVEEKLAPEPNAAEHMPEPPEVHFLRNYSNYLTPRRGALSADFWAFVASYLRNALLNLTNLILILLGLLLLPRTIVYLPHLLDRFDTCGGFAQFWRFGKDIGDPGCAQYRLLSIGVALALVGIVFMGLNLCWVEPHKRSTAKKTPWLTRPWAIQAFIVLPLFLAAALCGYALDQIYRFDLPASDLALWTFWLGALVYFGTWAIACLVRWIARRLVWNEGESGPPSWILLLTALPAGLICGSLLFAYAKSVIGAASPPGMSAIWRIMTLGVPGIVGIMLLIGTLHIGLMGRSFPDGYREWWARLGGWLWIYGVCWLVMFVLVAYVPNWLERLAEARYRYSITGSSVLLWAASTLYGVLFGRSPLTTTLSEDAPLKKKLPALAARITPYIFLLGLLVGLSVLAAWIAAELYSSVFRLGDAGEYVSLAVALAGPAFLVAALLLSWRVDINAFSTHLLYRNRLVRCYLGASVPDRQSQAQPFTGFSAADDLPLASLQIQRPEHDSTCRGRPIPLLNACLNVTRGHELALQTRKARSFAFSPLYSGYMRSTPESSAWQSVYADTESAGARNTEMLQGITLGTAMAISGAAASPNMGFYSAPALAFLMTLFDVRLGWWLGNPRDTGNWRKGSPDLGFWCLLRELFGASSDESGYVYLSDGGHFENLAIYELVRRRCRLIVASDASCDGKHDFGDLHNAMERCRADFGVEIRRTTQHLVLQDGFVSGHFDVCEIQYTPGDPRCAGVLLYLKPGLKGDDPEDLLAYRKTRGAFPHDTTADQWFDEKQFENYRMLGFVTGLAAHEEVANQTGNVLG